MAIFHKVLTKIDVERRLLVSEGCLSSLPRSEGCHGIVLQVKDELGKLWNFGCIIQAGAIQRLVIVSGWIQFVQKRELHSGDVVILHCEDDIMTGPRYKIEVKKSYNFCSVNKK